MVPTISVLMSVFNGEDYLQQALDSVLLQSFSDFELIIVDDGSTDGTNRILRACRDSRLKVISSESNMGLVDALNLSLQSARGRYVARMDADDISYPDRFARQVAEFQRVPDLVLLGSAFDYIDKNGVVFGKVVFSTDDQTIRQALRSEGNQFCHTSVMIRTDALRSMHGYRKLAGRYAQDYDLWLRLAEVGQIANIADALVGYRCHSEMLSITKLPLQRRAAEIYKVLARQRLAGEVEDLTAAEALLDKNAADMANELAGDLLRWSDMFDLMGEPDAARSLLWRAVRVAPFGTAIRQRGMKALGWRINRFLPTHR